MKSDFDIHQDRINFKIILKLVFKLKRKLLNLISFNFSTLNSNLSSTFIFEKLIFNLQNLNSGFNMTLIISILITEFEVFSP